MSARGRGSLDNAEELRRQFDSVFKAPLAPRATDIASFLAVRIGHDEYALRVHEIQSFVAARKVVPVPSTVPALLGLAGIRGVVVPVFSLGALMGYADDNAPPRWFVLCRSGDPIALAFADFEGYLELPASEVRPGAESGRTYVREVLQAGGALRGVVALGLVTTTIERNATARPIKER